MQKHAKWSWFFNGNIFLWPGIVAQNTDKDEGMFVFYGVTMQPRS